MKLIYVASPYAGDIEKNTEFAKEACRHVMNEGHADALMIQAQLV